MHELFFLLSFGPKWENKLEVMAETLVFTGSASHVKNAVLLKKRSYKVRIVENYQTVHSSQFFWQNWKRFSCLEFFPKNIFWESTKNLELIQLGRLLWEESNQKCIKFQETKKPAHQKFSGFSFGACYLQSHDINVFDERLLYLKHEICLTMARSGKGTNCTTDLNFFLLDILWMETRIAYKQSEFYAAPLCGANSSTNNWGRSTKLRKNLYHSITDQQN